MEIYNFSLIITAPVVDEEMAADSLYNGDCNDATFSVSNGVYEVEFDRKAASCCEAVVSAITNRYWVTCAPSRAGRKILQND